MSMVDHARRELEILGEDDDTIEMYLKVIQAFADGGHSGGSAMCAIPVINKLLLQENLCPLTDDPSEWMYVGEEVWGEPGGIWQSTRRYDAFSNDRGKTYYLLDERKKHWWRKKYSKKMHASIQRTENSQGD